MAEDSDSLFDEEDIVGRGDDGEQENEPDLSAVRLRVGLILQNEGVAVDVKKLQGLADCDQLLAYLLDCLEQQQKEEGGPIKEEQQPYLMSTAAPGATRQQRRANRRAEREALRDYLADAGLSPAAPVQLSTALPARKRTPGLTDQEQADLDDMLELAGVKPKP